jgi:hypothetical protein
MNSRRRAYGFAAGSALSMAAVLFLFPHHGTGGGNEKTDGGKAAAAADPNEAVNQPDQFAWELFVAINAPAVCRQDVAGRPQRREHR